MKNKDKNVEKNKQSNKEISKEKNAEKGKAKVAHSAKDKGSDKAKSAEKKSGPQMMSGGVGSNLKQKAGQGSKSKKAKKSDKEELDDTLLDNDGEASEEIEGLEEFDIEAGEDTEVEADNTSDSDVVIESITVSETTIVEQTEEEIFLTDAEGRRLCRVRDCDQASTTDGYCRYHYLLNWKRIQVRRRILMDGKLERYVEELTSRYPDKFLEMIRKDLRTEKDFLAAIAELEIDESGIDNDFEDESASIIDEVRGVSEGSGMSDEEEF